MYENFLGAKNPYEGLGDDDSVDEIILHVEELLDEGFYDKTVRDEAIYMLNTARSSTENPTSRDQIDTLLEDIESRYGEGKE